MSDTKCKCFTCTHKDTKLRRGYYEGYIAASDWFLNWAENQHVQAGHIADDDLPGIVAQMMYNREESAYLLEEVKTMERERRRANQQRYVANHAIQELERRRRYYAKNAEKIRSRNLDRYYENKLKNQGANQ